MPSPLRSLAHGLPDSATDLVALNLVVANNIGVRRGHLGIRGASLSSGARDALLLRRLGSGRRGLVRAVVLGSGGAAVVHAVGLVLVVGRLDVDVGDAAILAVARQGLVLVGRLGELGDNVPGVEEAGDEAQAAEEDVDEGVGAADAALDPDCELEKSTGLAKFLTSDIKCHHRAAQLPQGAASS